MNKQMIIGLAAEGPTDHRFLVNGIKRSFEDLAFLWHGNIEIMDIQNIYVQNAKFTDYLLEAATIAYHEHGVMVLCIHKDADAKTDQDIFINKIQPAMKTLE